MQNETLNLSIRFRKGTQDCFNYLAKQRHLRKSVIALFYVDLTLVLEVENETDAAGFCKRIISWFDFEAEIGAYVKCF